MIENFIVMESSNDSKEIYTKLFSGINNSNFKLRDKVYLFITKKQDNKLFFSNHKNWNTAEYILIGDYQYCNFSTTSNAGIALATAIANLIILKSSEQV